MIAPLFSSMSENSLIILERSCWWLHIIGIFAFLNYLPYSKHLHILLAFPNAYYGKLEPSGKMDNMPNVQNEVKYMMQPELAPAGDAPAQKFGAKDIFDLSWKNLLDAYSCTECGRCSTACPANQTGKLLSPRKIMMDTRDRLEEVGKNINLNSSFKDDGKTLLNNYITVEELRACTTCNACVEECPVSISPLDIIFIINTYYSVTLCCIFPCKNFAAISWIGIVPSCIFQKPIGLSIIMFINKFNLHFTKISI